VEEGKPDIQDKYPSEKGRKPTTNSTDTWHLAYIKLAILCTAKQGMS